MQLKMENLFAHCEELEKKGMTKDEIKELPIYLGNDDELNGIHTGWYADFIDVDDENNKDIVALINDDNCNITLNSTAILIS